MLTPPRRWLRRRACLETWIGGLGRLDTANSSLSLTSPSLREEGAEQGAAHAAMQLHLTRRRRGACRRRRPCVPACVVCVRLHSDTGRQPGSCTVMPFARSSSWSVAPPLRASLRAWGAGLMLLGAMKPLRMPARHAGTRYVGDDADARSTTSAQRTTPQPSRCRRCYTLHIAPTSLREHMPSVYTS